mmetsp:Transcript_6615/g.11661  ORF Transcript_6615/g.11661 Transcript_6615/m.11661 type:complete len:82 (+) Transcript_6615:46-291(+)
MPKARDPNKPRRPLSGFMYFSAEARPKVVKENPDMSFSEIGKRIGELWQDLDAEKRQPFLELGEADKIRYREAMRKYNSGE